VAERVKSPKGRNHQKKNLPVGNCAELIQETTSAPTVTSQPGLTDPNQPFESGRYQEFNDPLTRMTRPDGSGHTFLNPGFDPD
jgi:hypothetical protein